jgi:hypothetical protein
MIWARHVTYTGKRRGAVRVLVWKPERKRILECPWHRWKTTLKLIFRKCNGEA